MGEVVPEDTIEAQVLMATSYAHCLDVAVPEYPNVLGRHFLDVYTDPAKRAHTETMLRGFVSLEPSDPRHAVWSEHIGRYMRAFFGEPEAS